MLISVKICSDILQRMVSHNEFMSLSAFHLWVTAYYIEIKVK